VEATKQMKPPEGKYQTATQVKVLSPEIFNVGEADSVHLLEGSIVHLAKARDVLLSRGLSPWYGIEGRLQELGRSRAFPDNRISAYNLRRRGRRDDVLEVGLAHSRGVTGVMPCEDTIHSKGPASVCRDKGTHSPIAELEELWKRN
jgi:hypothetical protein